MSETINFNEMTIQQLRQYASHLRVPLDKKANKEQIIEALDSKLRNKTVAKLAEHTSSVPPGYAKIRINEDIMPGAYNYPVYVNANGYVCTIPRGVDVIVPNRVVRTLNDAMVRKRKQNTVVGADGREKFVDTTIDTLSYSFQVLEIVPGPEVRTALEERKLKTIGPRRRYRDKFGRWPRPKDLQRAIEQGLVSLNDDEELGIGVSELPNIT